MVPYVHEQLMQKIPKYFGLFKREIFYDYISPFYAFHNDITVAYNHVHFKIKQ